MENNIIEHERGIVIICGGNPLEGCPKNWDEAKLIEENLNNGKDEDEIQPLWSFDCGYKLDYDGALIHVSSRFYPPKTHYGPTWDGTVHIKILGETVEEKKFDCQTLDELKKEVDEYVNGVNEKIKSIFKSK